MLWLAASTALSSLSTSSTSSSALHAPTTLCWRRPGASLGSECTSLPLALISGAVSPDPAHSAQAASVRLRVDGATASSKTRDGLSVRFANEAIAGRFVSAINQLVATAAAKR